MWWLPQARPPQLRGSPHARPQLDDLALLETACVRGVFTLVALARGATNEARRARMMEHFGQTEASLQRLRGPIGVLYIGSKTPPEIAVSDG